MPRCCKRLLSGIMPKSFYNRAAVWRCNFNCPVRLVWTARRLHRRRVIIRLRRERHTHRPRLCPAGTGLSLGTQSGLGRGLRLPVADRTSLRLIGGVNANSAGLTCTSRAVCDFRLSDRGFPTISI